MAKSGRGKKQNGPALAAIGGGRASDGDELREQLAAAGAPAEALDALEQIGDISGLDEALDRLSEAGTLPAPDQTFAALLDHWRPLLRRKANPLEAELTGAEFLGMLSEMVPEEDLPAMLAGLIGQAGEHGCREALAMLRALAVVAGGETGPLAAAAADRLVAGGLADQPWVRGLGSPQVGRCFGYADEFGAQESIAVSFSYGRSAHALAVLIDHDLGGGVKDCFPTDRPDRLRAGYRQAARWHGLELRDYEPWEAGAILRRALEREPCPVQEDQIEDVGCYLSLLRARVSLLPGTAPAGTAASTSAVAREQQAPRAAKAVAAEKPWAATPAPAAGPTVHRLKVSLRGSKPPIWRRLEVPSQITLALLHDVIQDAFGWENYHLWVFTTPAGEFGRPDPELGHRSAAGKKLNGVVRRAGDRVGYTYDFGDDWEHDILVEDVRSAEPGVAYPRCVAGRRACPPEDCGGIWGYEELLAVLADPRHEDHEERLEWLGLSSARDFDPAAFDLDAVNDALSAIAKVLVKR